MKSVALCFIICMHKKSVRTL